MSELASATPLLNRSGDIYDRVPIVAPVYVSPASPAALAMPKWIR